MPMGDKQLQHSFRRDTPTIKTGNDSQKIVETVENVLLDIAKNEKSAVARVGACRVLLQHYHAKGEAQVSVDGLRMVQATLKDIKESVPKMKGELPGNSLPSEE